jgi:fatty-acyl-CoA synthase
VNISRWVAHRAEWAPEAVALHFRGADLTYAGLEGRVARAAAALAGGVGVRRGDRVAYLGLNSPEMLELLFACARLGAILVPLNWRLTVAEHLVLLADCEPAAIVVEPEFQVAIDRAGPALPGVRLVASGGTAPGLPGDRWIDYAALRDAAAPCPDGAGDMAAPLLIVYTSGTTGRPKGALLTQEALLYTALNGIAALDITSADHVLTILPMFHVGGLNIQTTPAIYAGGRITIARRFDAGEALALIRSRRPTLLLAVPTVAQALSSHRDFAATDLSSVRAMTTGSSVVPEAVIRPWLARGIPVTQVYGLTESGPTAIALPVADAARKVGSCGKPAIHTEARVVDPAGQDVARGERGEIWLRGPNLARGYWRNADATAEAFTGAWLHTGDIGHQDDQGYFYVDDRKKDVVISGGENVYPAELEAVLADCADIAEAAVVGRPDPRWGEVPVACVVPREGAVVTPEGVLALFRDRLARFKHPRDVVFLEALPRTAMGKVQKFELRERVARRTPSSA